MNNKVLAKVARTPTGPWSEPVTLYQATPITNGSSIYAAVPHPYYDQTGKSLVVTFTNHPNLIQAVKLVSRPCEKKVPCICAWLTRARHSLKVGDPKIPTHSALGKRQDGSTRLVQEICLGSQIVVATLQKHIV